MSKILDALKDIKGKLDDGGDLSDITEEVSDIAKTIVK